MGLILIHHGGFRYYYCSFHEVVQTNIGYRSSVSSLTWQDLTEKGILLFHWLHVWPQGTFTSRKVPNLVSDLHGNHLVIMDHPRFILPRKAANLAHLPYLSSASSTISFLHCHSHPLLEESSRSFLYIAIPLSPNLWITSPSWKVQLYNIYKHRLSKEKSC